VTVVARHAPRIHRFDSDPEWLGPKAMSGFSRTRDPRVRRRLIAAARHRGSMPPEIASDLRRELRCARAKWLEAEPVFADATPAGVQLRLDRAPHLLEVDRVVLATGFEVHRPGGALLGGRGDRPAWASLRRLRLPAGRASPRVGERALRDRAPGGARARTHRQKHRWRARRGRTPPCGGVMEAGNYGPDVKQDSAPSR